MASPIEPRDPERTCALADSRFDTWSIAFLVGALLLGLLRFVGLSAWSLWLDEALTLCDALHPPAGGLNNPLGYWLYGSFFDAGGSRPDEFALRIPAAILGFLTIPLTAWALAPSIGKRAATAAALFLAASSWHLYWSQCARFYTLSQVLALLGGGLFLRGLFHASRRLVFLGLLLGCAAALAHPSAAIFLGALLCTPWFMRWARLLEAGEEDRALWTALARIMFLLLFVGAGWALEVWLTWERSKGHGDPIHFVLSTGFLASPFLLGAALLGARRVIRARDVAALATVMVAAIGLLVALAASFLARVSAQYVFVLLPWIAAVAGLPFASTPAEEDPEERPRILRLRAILLALVLLPALLDVGLYFAVRNGDRPKWREAYAHVFDLRAEGDLVVGMDQPVGEYYLDPRATDLRRAKSVTYLDPFHLNTVREWRRFRRRMWFVVNFEQMQDWPADLRAEFSRVLEEECRLEKTFAIPWTPRDLDVHVYVRD